MKLSNEQATAALEATRALAKRMMPVAVAMKVRALGRELETRAQDVEAERMKGLDTFGKKDESGNLMTSDNRVLFPTPEAAAAFQTFNAELMANEIECKHTIKLSELGEGDIKPEILWGLGDLLEEDDE